MLREGLPNYMEEVLASLDLLLKWAVLRLSEGNTAVLLAVVAMLKVRLLLGACHTQRCYLSGLGQSLAVP